MNFFRFGLLFFLTLGLAACNSISSSRIKPTEIPPFVTSTVIPTNAPTLTPTATTTNTPTLVPTATPMSLLTNTPTQTSTPGPTKALITPTPTLAPIPAGMGALIIVNNFGNELNYDIASKLYKIKPNSSQLIFATPGNHTYSATIPGYAGHSGTVELRENYYRVQEWGP
jgi:hypothetical protein